MYYNSDRVVRIDIEKKSINSDRQGYEYLTSLYYEILRAETKIIELNFKKTQWIDANLAAVLGAILWLVRLNSYNVFFSNTNSNISSILTRNGFLSFGDFYKPSSIDDTVIKYWQFPSIQSDLFAQYVNQEILSKTCFPRCSEILKTEIIRNMFELFNNAVIHGNSEYIFTCGQHFPHKNPSKLDFTIVDIGNTFLYNVNEFKKLKGENELQSAYEAIDWASKESHSTKIGKPGGLGLSLLLNFIRLNKGKIQIVSDTGYWEYKEAVGNYIKSTNYNFPGAIINIEFNVDNSDDIYLLNNESLVSIDNIF